LNRLINSVILMMMLLNLILNLRHTLKGKKFAMHNFLTNGQRKKTKLSS